MNHGPAYQRIVSGTLSLQQLLKRLLDHPQRLSSTCALVLVIAWFGWNTNGFLLALGGLICLSLGLIVRRQSNDALPSSLPVELETPLRLARDAEIYERYRQWTERLLRISQQTDPIFRHLALEELDAVLNRVTSVAAGTLVFEGTERWRMEYERLLRSTGLYLYRSVAWVRQADYWQDEPGRKSMAVNFEMLRREQLDIERIVIIADELWPESHAWPVEPLRRWMHTQYQQGLELKFVRVGMLRQEPDLLMDMGIYGSRALGIQEADATGRTVRFVLTFDYTKVTEAEERWNRLLVYAESYADHLDR